MDADGTSMRNLWAHVLAYSMLLVALVAATPLDSSFSGDAGAYGGQVFALRQGGWALQRPLPVVPEVNEGWLNTAITPDGPTPYTANPGYAMALTAVVRGVHGPAAEIEPGAGSERAGNLAVGLRVLPVTSAVAAAAVAWLLARRLAPDAGPLAFWLVALGPVLVNATTLWAHTLSSALGGAAMLAMVTATEHGTSRRRRIAALAALTLALAAAAVVRTEALFWIVAVTAVAAVRASGWSYRVAAAAGGLVAAGLWFTNRQWGASLRAERLPIETSVTVLEGEPGWLAGRFPAAWLLLVDGRLGAIGTVASLLALLALSAAVLSLWRDGAAGRSTQAVLLGAAAAAYILRAVSEPSAPISGLLLAWPAMALLVLAPRFLAAERPRQMVAAGTDNEDEIWRRPWVLLGPSIILLLAVLATQYASSGGLQWGGRYLSFAFVPMAAAAAVGGHHLMRDRSLRYPLAALMLVPALVGALTTLDLHRHHDDAVAQASVGEPTVVVTESAALVRIAWRELPTAYHRASADDIDALLEDLARAGVQDVNVHGLLDVPVDGTAGYRVVGSAGPTRILQLQSPGDGA